jgi:2-polyprenyl-3-methyl-5-hydroxy-6-metoxy-1,4-benzoquinol methylase
MLHALGWRYSYRTRRAMKEQSKIRRWTSDKVRRTRVFGAWEKYQARRHTTRALRESGLDAYFDERLKRRVISGDRLSLEEMKDKYDLVWEGIVDDCVTGDDLDEILSRLSPESETCLDVGCGAGRVAVEIAKTKRKVTASDISRTALAHAEERVKANGVEITCVETPMEKLPFADRAFDAVVCVHTLEHVQDLDAAVSELIRVAAKQLIIIVPREDQVTDFGTDYHLQCFPSPEALSSAVPLEVFECFIAKVENPQWHGEYVFYSGRIPDREVTAASS